MKRWIKLASVASLVVLSIYLSMAQGSSITSSLSGGGTLRSIVSVSSATAAGSAVSTDYVYLVSGTTTVTLPTAASNTNLYTVKRVGTGTVTIATTGGQTIDGSSSAALTVQYQSLSFISDGSNWNVQ